jgi:hypothetical protein
MSYTSKVKSAIGNINNFVFHRTVTANLNDLIFVTDGDRNLLSVVLLQSFQIERVTD